MALQIVLNLLIAIIWMFFSDFTFSNFLFGYLIGFVLLLMLSPFIPGTFYFKKLWAIIVLVGLFVKELVLANLEVLKWVYKPKLDMQSGIMALPIDLTGNREITLLANLITLTPGTLSVDVSENNDFLYVHAIDMPDVDESIQDIKETFEKAIMEVTR